MTPGRRVRQDGDDGGQPGRPVREYATPVGPVIVVGELSRGQIESAHRLMADVLRRRRPDLFREAGRPLEPAGLPTPQARAEEVTL